MKEMKSVLYMPDGNRRFAKQNNISLADAYYLGGKSLRLLSEFFVAEGRSKRLIYYGSSNYTPKRSDSSVDIMVEGAERTFKELIKEDYFKKNDISLKVLNHSWKLPSKFEEAIEYLSESTKDGKKGEVVVLIGYSLEKDINQALSQHPQDYNSLKKGVLFSDIDLVIRPKEMRLSNAPIYAMSQAQMMTIDKFNPEVKREDLERLWQDYVKLREYKTKSNPHHK